MENLNFELMPSIFPPKYPDNFHYDVKKVLLSPDDKCLYCLMSDNIIYCYSFPEGV